MSDDLLMKDFRPNTELVTENHIPARQIGMDGFSPNTPRAVHVAKALVGNKVR